MVLAGACRVAWYLYYEPNPDLQPDLAGHTRELLEKCSLLRFKIQCITMPPSIFIDCPVMDLASSEAR